MYPIGPGCDNSIRLDLYSRVTGLDRPPDTSSFVQVHESTNNEAHLTRHPAARRSRLGCTLRSGRHGRLGSWAIGVELSDVASGREARIPLDESSRYGDRAAVTRVHKAIDDDVDEILDLVGRGLLEPANFELELLGSPR